METELRTKRLNVGDLNPGEYYVVEPGGAIYKPEDYVFKDDDFKALVDHEVLRPAKPKRGRAAHIDLMRKLKLVEGDPLSDSGHLSLLPRGALIFDLLADRALQIALEQGATPVHTSIMYDLRTQPIREHTGLFGSRMYRLKPAKRPFILRYAACFGQFSMLSRHTISHAILPLRIYELADSYRFEQRGEIQGLSRLRRFHMPDMHAICRDLKEAMSEFERIYRLCMEEGERAGWTYHSLINAVEDFLKDNWGFLTGLVDYEGKPILLHVIEPGIYYWVINVEFNSLDSSGRPVESSTVQIDVGNAQRFDITYVDEDGDRRHPAIIHTAIIGSVERFICNYLEREAKAIAEKRVPMLPTWLAPTQVRFIPVSDIHLPLALTLAEELNRHRIRTDVDDREATVAKKVRYAESLWVPYVVVVGRKEAEGDKLSVRVRSSGGIEDLDLDDLAGKIKDETDGMPFRPLYYPVKLSCRPGFY